MDADVVVAGAGLAGACAAFCLSASRRVLVLDAGAGPGAGASGAAAGLVHPFPGTRARPAWRALEAMDALHALLAEASANALFHASGVLRTARDKRQAEAFAQTAAAYPGHAAWLDPEASAERFGHVEASHGALWIPSGGHAALPALVEALLRGAEARGAEVRWGTRLAGWAEASGGVIVRVEAEGRGPRAEDAGPRAEGLEASHGVPRPSGENSRPAREGAEASREGTEAAAEGRGPLDEGARASGRDIAITGYAKPLRARHLVLALGGGMARLPSDASPLPLHLVKGQTARLARPEALDAGGPAVAAGAYLVPGRDSVTVGATFEHVFADLVPDRAQSLALRTEAARWVPLLAEAQVLGEAAGVRVTVPAAHSPRRLPLVGPTAPGSAVWAFTGLGAKGLLLAPILARGLPGWLDSPGTALPELAPG